MYSLQACMRALFSPEKKLTGWGSERVKEVGTPPPGSNLHASLIAVSATVRIKVPRTNPFNLLDNRRTAVVQVIYCVQSPLLQGEKKEGCRKPVLGV